MLKKGIFILILMIIIIVGFTANQAVYASELDSIISDADNFLSIRRKWNDRYWRIK